MIDEKIKQRREQRAKFNPAPKEKKEKKDAIAESLKNAEKFKHMVFFPF